MRLKDILKQFDGITGEYRVCRIAVERLYHQFQQDPSSVPRSQIRVPELPRTLRRLENTFLVHIFALFEAALRELWANAFHRTTDPPVRVLIDVVGAATKFLPSNFIDPVHQVRELRNAIVHLNLPAPPPYTFSEAAHDLRAYLSLMPRQW
ncbi:MAG TPA: hypothetical protein VHQ47_00225 [Phycisphaerae bacterium]|nr:hypothetical protein [Phycisphaerae bacterium]